MTKKIITHTVWILSLVSLFTDVASEMLYPVMPIYLKSIGFSIILIGVLEGFAEAIAGLSKGYFGKLSDVSGRRLPFVQLGYLLSTISKPLMAVFTYPVWVFIARTIDRLGKGIRTGARDAMLSDEATPKTKGSVFGFHRGMDTLGAAIGPFLALVFLGFYPNQYTLLFFIAFVPGIIAVALSFFIKEKKITVQQKISGISFFQSFYYIKESMTAYRKLLVGLLLFTLFNSSDVFLLLMVKHHGYSDSQVIGLYIFYNLVYAAFAYPFGKLSDKIGKKNTLMMGLFIFAVVYAGMGFSHRIEIFYFLFFLYGVYAAATEGVSKALISNICDKKDVALALGTYAGFNSIAALLASSLAGLLWYFFNPSLTFIITSVVAFVVIVYLSSLKINEQLNAE